MDNFSKQMEMVLYHSNDGDVSINAYIKDDTLWITQKAMAKLFGVGVPAINKHLSNIFEEGELSEAATISKMEIVQTSHDSEIAYHFYATVQNKFHYAITSQTAAEIVYSKADHTKEHMGLTTWKNAPDGRILKSDVGIAKNYLSEKQIRQLERAVSGYFDYIEDLIERENVFTMEEFEKSVNAFLEFRQYKILPDNGKVSHKQALDKAFGEYDIFNRTQPIESDFDKILKKLEEDDKTGK
ncbi:MAG: RhuM family protein [Oribacterium sp.]|nr:RhuM family protein [Oribacterium sp.]